jgi:pimeloyl-ACP methyl ester carboxylesterase
VNSRPSSSELTIERHWPESSGWELDVRRHSRPDRFDPALRPVLLVPGYCMNTTPLGYHPEGESMIEFLAGRGFEVWTSNLRGQGDSRPVGGARNVGFRELALGDLARAIGHVRSETKTATDRVDVVGCSLGGTYLFVYLAHHPEDHGIGSVVAIGAPLRWEGTHPLFRAVFASPRLAAALPIAGTRRAMGLVMPFIAARAPSLLSMYLNASTVDLSCAPRLVQTVEDPIPRLNGEIAHWVRDRDLTVEGVNVTEALGRVDRPLLCIVANRDGVVPTAAARSALDAFGSRDRELLAVGDDDVWFAHADLFISRHAQKKVFEPLAEWLRTR